MKDKTRDIMLLSIICFGFGLFVAMVFLIAVVQDNSYRDVAKEKCYSEDLELLDIKMNEDNMVVQCFKNGGDVQVFNIPK